MVCGTEGGPCGCGDLPGAMTIAGERVSECHREASRVGRGRKFLGGRCARPVAVASRSEQRQFAASPVLEPQISCSALEVAAPNDDRAAVQRWPMLCSCHLDHLSCVGRHTGPLSRAAADDHDRAGRVLGALLADGAKQKVGEAAVAAGADYQQVSFADGVDQHSSRWAFGDNELDLELVLLAELAGRALEPLLCSPPIVDGVVDRFGAVRVTDERGNQ
jgi:hypothetical protein